MELQEVVRKEVQKYQWDSGEEQEEADVIARRIIELVRKVFKEKR